MGKQVCQVLSRFCQALITHEWMCTFMHAVETSLIYIVPLRHL